MQNDNAIKMFIEDEDGTLTPADWDEELPRVQKGEKEILVYGGDDGIGNKPPFLVIARKGPPEPKSTANSLMYLLHDSVGEEPLDKHYWLSVAEHLGPDYAQTLYRAAVFVTKVA